MGCRGFRVCKEVLEILKRVEKLRVIGDAYHACWHWI